jgi:hypothetical protein
MAIVALTVLATSTSALAGDLSSSIANAAQQQAETAKGSMPRAHAWSGSVLLVGGLSYAFYNFLNTGEVTGREGNLGGEWGSKYTKRGAVGLAVAGAGAIILFKGQQRRTAPTLTFGRGAVKVTKQFAW